MAFRNTINLFNLKHKQDLLYYNSCAMSNMGVKYFDVVVIGGGIVGVTTARALLMEKPSLRVALVEKEEELARHQSGHNSGVIHAGIYYKTGSLKAKLCVEGLRRIYELCDDYGIPYRKCGKLIVATNQDERLRLAKLYQQGVNNKSPGIRLVNADEIREIEPHCRGIEAIYSPNTGIINWAEVTKFCAHDFEEKGGSIFLNFSVSEVSEVKEAESVGEIKDVSTYPLELRAYNNTQVIRSKYAIACAGLYSDRVAEICGGSTKLTIVPFRGEYLELKEDKQHLVNGNIYPVPDPKFPFLGVHFTPLLDGRIIVGPNAILAFSREGYKWTDINLQELTETLLFPGFQKLILRYGKFGLKEVAKSFFKHLQLKELQKYIPELRSHDLVYRNFCGVRAQALNSKGELIDDMLLELGSTGIAARILHVRNAPSPAATSSLALSEYIVKKALIDFEP